MEAKADIQYLLGFANKHMSNHCATSAILKEVDLVHNKIAATTQSSLSESQVCLKDVL